MAKAEATVSKTAELIVEVAGDCDKMCGGLHAPQIEGIVEGACQNANARLFTSFREDVRAAMKSKPVEFPKVKADK